MLDLRWVERIFQRGEDRYGSAWAAKYGDFPRARVMQTWAEDLAPFAGRGSVIAKAIEAMADCQYPPGSPEFRALCKDAAREEDRKAEAAKPALEYNPTAEERERSAEAARKATQAVRDMPGRDPLGWAKRPASQIALNAVIELAKTDSRFPEILSGLVQSGITDGRRLLIPCR